MKSNCKNCNIDPRLIKAEAALLAAKPVFEWAERQHDCQAYFEEGKDCVDCEDLTELHVKINDWLGVKQKEQDIIDNNKQEDINELINTNCQLKDKIDLVKIELEKLAEKCSCEKVATCIWTWTSISKRPDIRNGAACWPRCDTCPGPSTETEFSYYKFIKKIEHFKNKPIIDLIGNL